MAMNEEIILPDDDRAASIKTVTGWVSRRGYFYGDDERLARYDGSTHNKCEKCGNVADKSYTKCEPCREASREERRAKFPSKVWDQEGFVYSDSLDRFFDIDGLLDYIYDENVNIEDLHLLICEPSYAFELEPYEVYVDLLATEDGETDLPAEIEDAFEELNEKIRKCRTPISWQPVNIRAIVEISNESSE